MSRFQTLIRIGQLRMRADRMPPHIRLTIPGWDHRMVVSLAFWSLPKDIRNSVHEHFMNTSNEPFRCYAEVNMDADQWEDLVFSNWELA